MLKVDDGRGAINLIYFAGAARSRRVFVQLAGAIIRSLRINSECFSTTAVYILFGRREPSASVVSLSGSVLMFSTPHGPVQHMFDSLAGVPQQMR